MELQSVAVPFVNCGGLQTVMMTDPDVFIPETYDEAFHGHFQDHPYLKKLEYRKLGSTPLKVSNISLGTGHLGSGYYETYGRSEEVATVQEAIKSGINLIDTSPWYGNSEWILGEALKGVPRKAYYVATKAGRNFTPTWEGRFDFSRSAILRSVERSLERLGLDYLDIIQVHDVEFADDLDQIINETLPALQSVVQAGKAKYIGLTSYDLKALKTVAEQADVDTILTYCRYNIHDVSLRDYLPFFQEKGIGIINGSAVAMGLLTTKGPPAWHPASSETKELARKASALAIQKGTAIEDVALHFSFKPPEESIATTLVGTPTRAMLKQNLDAAVNPSNPTYQEFRAVFGNRNHEWEGVEVGQMRHHLQQSKQE